MSLFSLIKNQCCNHCLKRDINVTRMFICDKDVARLLGMSPSWVRGQRYKRRRGLDHFLQIDPCLISSAVRYRRTEVEALASAITADVGVQ